MPNTVTCRECKGEGPVICQYTREGRTTDENGLQLGRYRSVCPRCQEDIEAVQANIQAALGLIRMQQRGQRLGVFHDRSDQVEGRLNAALESLGRLR